MAFAVLAVPAAAGETERTGPIEYGQADAAGQLAQACPRIYRPVCAFTRGGWRTYSNSCLARNAGARLIRQGACQNDSRRVCCLRGTRTFSTTFAACRRAGGRVTAERNCRVDNRRVCCQRGNRNFFTDHRQCRRLGGRAVVDQRCRAGACSDRRPVCGFWRGRRVDFANICQMRRRGGRFIRYGRCAAPPPRTCHQPGTSRRFNHIQGRSWPRACQTRPQPRTCHQPGTSRRYPHIQGRSWNPACSAGGGGTPQRPQAGSPCSTKDRHGITVQGRIFIDAEGRPVCMSESGGRPRP